MCKFHLCPLTVSIRDCYTLLRRSLSFSLCLFGSCIDGFSRKILQLKAASTNHTPSLTRVCLCTVHMLKAVSMRLTRKQLRQGMCKLMLSYFGALQCISSLVEASDVYHNICLTLTAQHESPVVTVARQCLLEYVSVVYSVDGRR